VSATAGAGTKGASAKKTTRSRATKDGSGQLDGGRARDREVIEAAVEIFWEKGYANTSVQDVADRLGMLKGSLYYYINAKESLLAKIFEDSHSEIRSITDAAMASEGTSLNRLTRFLTNYAMWTLTHLKRAGLYSREWRYASEDLRASLMEQSRYYNRSLRSLIVACQEEGSIPLEVDARLAPNFIWAAFTALPDWFNPARDTEASVAERYVGMALGALSVSVENARPGTAGQAPAPKPGASASARAAKKQTS
jgi:AcrR family transcriptional regulator